MKIFGRETWVVTLAQIRLIEAQASPYGSHGKGNWLPKGEVPIPITGVSITGGQEG